MPARSVPPAPETAQARAAVLPTAGVGAAGALAAAPAGLDAFLGVIAGAVLVLALFGTTLLLSFRTARYAPHAVMAVAMLSYLAKVVALGLVLVLLGDTTLFDPRAFGLSVLLTSLVWLGAQVWAFTRVPMLYVDPESVSR